MIHNNIKRIQIIMMMVHQLCRLQKISQVIEIIGVHLQLMDGVLQLLYLLVVRRQLIGMHQLQPLLVLQLAGDLKNHCFSKHH
jgi:hypothetical protein